MTKCLRVMCLAFVIALPQIFTAVVADEDSVEKLLDDIRASYVRMLPFYRKLYDCTQYSTSVNNVPHSILGKENQKCHVKMGSYNCYFPLSIMRQYSLTLEKDARSKIDQIDSQDSFSYSTDEKATQNIQNYNDQYCTIEWQ